MLYASSNGCQPSSVPYLPRVSRIYTIFFQKAVDIQSVIPFSFTASRDSSFKALGAW